MLKYSKYSLTFLTIDSWPCFYYILIIQITLLYVLFQGRYKQLRSHHFNSAIMFMNLLIQKPGYFSFLQSKNFKVVNYSHLLLPHFILFLTMNFYKYTNIQSCLPQISQIYVALFERPEKPLSGPLDQGQLSLSLSLSGIINLFL